jgi:hypothetical protein
VADKLGIDLIWFGIILALNLQTSFLTPPFGFALFYLRSVAAKVDYDDRITGQRIKAVTTTQIYKGSIAFIILQVIMVVTIVLNPGLVTGSIDKGPMIDADKALEGMGWAEPGTTDLNDLSAEGAASAPPPGDAMQRLLESMQRDADAASAPR